MKISSKNLMKQRVVIEKKITKWLPNRNDPIPPSGWIKAIRRAFGISTRQLAKLLDVNIGSVHTLEKREAKGKATLEVIEKAAKAMNCKLIYAIVPKEPYQNLDAIIQEKTIKLAKEIIEKVEHSMRLEKQGSEITREHIERLAKELKEKIDPRIWGDSKKRGTKTKGK